MKLFPIVAMTLTGVAMLALLYAPDLSALLRTSEDSGQAGAGLAADGTGGAAEDGRGNDWMTHASDGDRTLEARLIEAEHSRTSSGAIRYGRGGSDDPCTVDIDVSVASEIEKLGVREWLIACEAARDGDAL